MFEVWKEKLNPVGTPKTWLGLKPQEKKNWMVGVQ